LQLISLARAVAMHDCTSAVHAPPPAMHRPIVTPIATQSGPSATQRPCGLVGQLLSGGFELDRISIDMPSFKQERFEPYPLAVELEDIGQIVEFIRI